jgi:parallel beta-helix repeat protein
LVVDGNKANQASGDQIGVYLDDMGTLSTGVVGATIRDIVAKNLTRGGVNLFSSELTTISNITVLSIDSYAIDISGNSSNANKIVGNTVKDSNYGIFLGWGENNVVTNNILDSNDYGIYSSAYRSTISNNTFRSNERAIFLEAATHNVVEGNVIYNSTLDGIYITSASNNIINENILQDNGGATANNAIYLTASDNNTITDNSITDSSASTTNYPININNSSSDNNYLSGNKFTSTPGTSTIRDIGTGTRFASQSVAEGGLNMLYKQTASATAFQVQNASAAALFTADSTNNRLEVGSSTTDSTAIFFTLDKYNNGTDPAGVDGAMYYNTSLNKFRCYQNAAWTDCVLTPGSISQSLLASASNSIDIGSSGTTWRSGYFGTSLSSPVIRPAADGTTAFKLQNAGGTLDYLTLDTTNSRISIGVSDTTGTLLVLDTKTSAGDPTGVDGAMYYNSSMARFRCYESGAWKNCTGANPTNGSTATQGVTAGSDTYVTSSDLLLPTGGLQGPTSGATNGTKITWKVVMSKTAAGTAASTFTLRMGTNGTTADTSRCTFSTGHCHGRRRWSDRVHYRIRNCRRSFVDIELFHELNASTAFNRVL